MSNAVLAVDLGGTQLRAAVVDAQGQLLSRARADTLAREGAEAVIARVRQTARAALEQSPRKDVVAIGLSGPGPINPQTGVIYTAPNMPGWENVPIAELLADEFGMLCFAGNDGNLAALGEGKFGAGRGCNDLVYLTISTGIGSGVISSGMLIVGKDGLAVEAGHIILEPNGPRCGCGNYGCLESLASGTSIARIVEEHLARGEVSSLQAQRGQVTAKLVEEHARQGDALAAEVFQRAATYIGLGIASLINLFNPEVVILGGSVTNAGELLFGPVRAVALSRSMPMLRQGVRIVVAELGDNVGLLGAAVYAFERLKKEGGY